MMKLGFAAAAFAGVAEALLNFDNLPSIDLDQFKEG